jgi:hypothetical protein
MTNGSIINITNCRAVSNPTIWNATNGVAIPSNNYTLTSNIVTSSGQLATSVTPNVSVIAGNAYNKGTATIDGTCEPVTYDENSGGRAVTGLIIVMFGLALAAVAIYPTLKEMELFNR